MKTYNLDQIKAIPIFDFLEGWNRKSNYDSYIYENCPFCSHKWHFSVSKNGRLFHSHNSCVKGGSVIDFVMLTENLSFSESVRKLADRYSVNGSETIKLRKYEIERNKKIAVAEEIRERELINSFFDYLKIKKYDKTFYKILDWDNKKILHYIYDLLAAGAIEIG